MFWIAAGSRISGRWSTIWTRAWSVDDPNKENFPVVLAQRVGESREPASQLTPILFHRLLPSGTARLQHNALRQMSDSMGRRLL